MTPFVDHYAVLEVPFGADRDRIRRAYKQKAFANHPDRHPEREESTAVMQRLNAARQALLTTPERRESYDRRWKRKKLGGPSRKELIFAQALAKAAKRMKEALRKRRKARSASRTDRRARRAQRKARRAARKAARKARSRSRGKGSPEVGPPKTET